jgi:hypothetical protein
MESGSYWSQAPFSTTRATSPTLRSRAANTLIQLKKTFRIGFLDQHPVAP